MCEKVVKTVGELKAALEGVDDSMPLDLAAFTYDRNNWVQISRDIYKHDKEGISLTVETEEDDGFTRLRISNENTEDMVLRD